jgi:hypothetical protein
VPRRGYLRCAVFSKADTLLVFIARLLTHPRCGRLLPPLARTRAARRQVLRRPGRYRPLTCLR